MALDAFFATLCFALPFLAPELFFAAEAFFPPLDFAELDALFAGAVFFALPDFVPVDFDDLDEPRFPPVEPEPVEDVDVEDLPLERPTAFAAIAPKTPPTTAPTGPATLPMIAPVAAPAVCLEMGGMVIFSEEEELRFELDLLVAIGSYLVC